MAKLTKESKELSSQGLMKRVADVLIKEGPGNTKQNIELLKKVGIEGIGDVYQVQLHIELAPGTNPNSLFTKLSSTLAVESLILFKVESLKKVSDDGSEKEIDVEEVEEAVYRVGSSPRAQTWHIIPPKSTLTACGRVVATNWNSRTVAEAKSDAGLPFNQVLTTLGGKSRCYSCAGTTHATTMNT